MDELIRTIAAKTGIAVDHVRNIIGMVEDGATIPFIARYRKELTGGATDEQLRAFDESYQYSRKLLARKQAILRLIEERGHISDAIRKALNEADSLTVLEDIYRPFKEKKSTRAGVAIARGLQPLADALRSGKLSTDEFLAKARDYVGGDVKSVEAAVAGAQDIIAERFSDNQKERELFRNHARRNGALETKAGKSFDPKGVFGRFDGQSEKIAWIPSHRYLAVMRGVAEKHLVVKIRIDSERALENIRRYWIPRDAGSSRNMLFDALADGLKRLLTPSIEREMHSELKERSDKQAISVFGTNLSQLLMTPPVTGIVLLGVDPAYRTGCKLAVIDENGTYLAHAVIHPTPPQNDYAGARETVLDLIRRFKITGVAIGNGTASRETQEFFARLNRDEDADIHYTVVSEAGASVYSASKIAQEEYPDLDVTIRGAISIAERLRNPMAALVKIDPKALGIGQYQHDVDQKLLERKLAETTEDLVNRVGVDINSASASLVSYIAGIGPKLAKSIVLYRKEHGSFGRKLDLKKVSGLGTKAFEQCAGFVRIPHGASVLDNTGIHPESYRAATTLSRRFEPSALDLALAEPLAKELDIGIDTIRDIIQELKKPGFDPREELPQIPFRQDLTDISMLKPESIVAGVVRSIVDFGAFVDIGLKNDGLIHISEMSDKRISHPMEVLSVNQFLPRIRVLQADVDTGKVSLSLNPTSA
jgi:protein Tex